MGGYGAFIWPAYGVAAVVMIGLLITSLHSSRANSRELAELEASGRGRRRAKTDVPESKDTSDDPQAS
jgi:heme exporter protein D